ncbi:MAG: GspH/FimT family pseudopilin [Betaproteobacteria bacterium]
MAIADLGMVMKALGFTLIELMVALAIVALLLLLGMPSFTTFLRNSEIRSTAESLINGLRTASAEATRQNEKVVFTLGPGADWAINRATNADCTGLVNPPIQQFAGKEVGKNSKITVTPAKTTVCFNGLGRIVNQGTAGDHIQQIEVQSFVANEARSLRIIVDDTAAADPTKPRGMRMCDPDAALKLLVPPDPRAC